MGLMDRWHMVHLNQYYEFHQMLQLGSIASDCEANPHTTYTQCRDCWHLQGLLLEINCMLTATQAAMKSRQIHTKGWKNVNNHGCLSTTNRSVCAHFINFSYRKVGLTRCWNKKGKTKDTFLESFSSAAILGAEFQLS